MFRNHEIRVVRTDEPKQLPQPPRPRLHPYEWNALVRTNIKDAVLLAGACYAAKKALDIVSDTALLAAKTYIK